MNRKAQMAGIAGLIMLAMSLIVGAILLQSAAQQVGTVIDTVNVNNVSLGVASNSTAVYLTDYRAISSVVVWNQSNKIVPAGNYTVTDNVIDPTTGGLSVKFLPTSPAIENWTGWTWKISGTGQPVTYDDNSGNRSIISLIVIFMALALLVAAVAYAVKTYYY